MNKKEIGSPLQLRKDLFFIIGNWTEKEVDSTEFHSKNFERSNKIPSKYKRFGILHKKLSYFHRNTKNKCRTWKEIRWPHTCATPNGQSSSWQIIQWIRPKFADTHRIELLYRKFKWSLFSHCVNIWPNKTYTNTKSISNHLNPHE